MVGVLFEMSRVILINDWRAIVIAVMSIGITFGLKKSNAMWTVLGGSLLGYLLLLF
jgi:chromate transporter